ncbi:MAG: bifunctional phosphoglucose/phosphomannose isomerase [Chloroflexota bacterium]|nr:bifunctional phosphoglucose/phosphomannose isomerase [Chloroflexota bacterium]
MNLDDRQPIRCLDSSNMLGRIAELPRQCTAAWEQSMRLALPSGYSSVDHVTIAGMGGSAIGGALLKGLVVDECLLPITVVRGYTLPAFVEGPRSLVIACSYSGNTEETLSCFEQARARGARAAAVTTGGKLADLADEAGVPVARFDYESQPRAAIGYSFVLLLGLMHQLGIIHDYSDEVTESAQVMEAWQEQLGVQVPIPRNPAKQMASRLACSLPVIYGAGFLAAVANRWKTQFNENAKHWAFFEVLPELNHNAVVGLGIPAVIRDNSVVLMLRSPLDHQRVQERWDVTRDLLTREGVAAEEVHGRGDSALAQMLSLIHLGDYVSFYTAMLNEVDPTPVDAIAFLKQRLAELGSALE